MYSCALCGKKSSIYICAKDENRRVTEICFDYLKCSSCKSVYISEIPEDLGKYYQDEYYRIPSIVRLKKIAKKSIGKLETITRFASRGRLLEVGPAFGVLAWQAKEFGFDVNVIEMDRRCCDFLQNYVDVNVVQSDSPHIAMKTMQSHDVIAIWHVMEHLPEPLSLLQAAAENLVAGGFLVVAMPNPESFQFKLMGSLWPHLDAPRHLRLMTANFFINKAKDHGLEAIYLTADDREARNWNLFGWQRLLMNRFKGMIIQKLMFILGTALGVVMVPFDRWAFNGSAYTVVLKKVKP